MLDDSKILDFAIERKVSFANGLLFYTDKKGNRDMIFSSNHRKTIEQIIKEEKSGKKHPGGWR